ncbi:MULTISPECIES: hypothetical protein [unclassified Siphonobacter]|nr:MULTISPECIES: hypothetical protein [unclassified Siphonobacter]MDQ1089595.1 hypothetical protein [Siphonobacter sp. SORGH_AS_1065]MDR6195844.1 hypothetical protein [Siphonobacter sp. SORGH_AS_0500]
MEQKATTPGWKGWIKRLGWAGFFFFLIKGLLWLALGYFGLKIFE